MRRLVENDERRGAERQQPRNQERDSSHSDFLPTHLIVFADATDPLEADSWLHTTESKFGLLHCIEYQKTLYTSQQLRGSAGAWWATYTAALPTDHHIPWGEYCTTFCAHHLSMGLLNSELKKFLDLEQGNHSVFDYTRQFNNSYQESLRMAPFEVSYGSRCRTPLNWIENGEKVIFGPDLVEEAKAIVHRIQDNLKATKSCQEAYANKRRRPIEFEVGDHVYLRVLPMKSMKRFGLKGKLAPHYIRPFPIFEKCGIVAYKLDLPPS
jgi:hypothetical protein